MLSPNEHIRPTPPLAAGSSVSGYTPQVLARNVIPRQLTQAELVRIVLHALKAHRAPQHLEVQINRPAPAHGSDPPNNVHPNSPGVSAFTRPSFSADSATATLIVEQGSAPAPQRQFLVHHGQDAPVRRIDGKHRPVHIAQASTAAARTTGSSPALTSFAVKAFTSVKLLAVNRSP